MKCSTKSIVYRTSPVDWTRQANISIIKKFIFDYRYTHTAFDSETLCVGVDCSRSERDAFDDDPRKVVFVNFSPRMFHP